VTGTATMVEEWRVYADNEPIELLMEAGAE
jgi:hypothetical protein